MNKSELRKVQMRLDGIEAELEELKAFFNHYISQDVQTILMYEASIGKEDSMLEQLPAEELKEYAAACKYYIEFGWEVDACMADALERRTAVRLGKVPDILEKLGCEKKDMYITQKHLRSILHNRTKGKSHYHDIDIRQFKQLPELLAHPLAVVSDRYERDVVVVVLDAKDKDDNQLIVPIKKNGKAFYQGNRVEANFILSTYGKTNTAQYLERCIAENRVLYMDKKISTSLGEVPLQLRQFLNGTYINIIPRKAQNVNENNLENRKNQAENRADIKPDRDMSL